MSTSLSERDRKIVLLGATGFVGKPTFHALERVVGGNRISVVSRNPGAPVCAGFAAAGARVDYGDMHDEDSLVAAFTGADAVYLITPGCEERVELMQTALNAVKKANVPFVLVLSMCTADNKRTIFGKHFSEIEKATKACGVPYAIIRVPMFTDNLWSLADGVRKGKLSSPMDPAAKHTTLTVEDCAQAAAAILTHPDAHGNKTYNLAGPVWCNNDAAEAFTTALGRSVTAEQITYDDAERQYTAMGWWEPWQIKGMLELMHMADDGRYVFKDRDFTTVVGREPTPMERWVDSVKTQLCTSHP